MNAKKTDGMAELASAVQKLSGSVKTLKVSSLTAAVARAANWPHSVAEVLRLREDIENMMNPRPKNGAYVEWVKASQDRLAAPRG